MAKKKRKREPLWKGPEVDGITFSLLSRYLECKERFRLRVVEGLVEDEGFNHALEYGSIFHEAEEAHRDGQSWRKAIKAYTQKLCKKYMGSEEQIAKWASLCAHQFPVYIQYWAKHPSTGKRRYIFQEKAFRVPYTLPESRRTIILRGKWDSGYIEGKGEGLQENKTKGYIDEEGITATLSENLQTMLYFIARLSYKEKHQTAQEALEESDPPLPLKSVLYNVIRRPLSDKYSIRQRKAETQKDFHIRAADQMREDPSHHFKRWKVSIYKQDVERFKREVFNPLLEELLIWWDWIQANPFNPWEPRTDNPYEDQICPHYRSPWGAYNSLASGFRGSYFGLLTRGSKVGLERVSCLFPELEEDH